MRTEQAVCDVLPGHPLARNIDDFLTDLANENRPRNTYCYFQDRLQHGYEDPKVIFPPGAVDRSVIRRARLLWN